MKIVLTLQKQSTNAFNISTRYELTEEEFFLRPLPDLYLSRRKPKDSKQLDYTLDIFEPMLPTWVLRKRLRAYQDHCEEAELDDGEYPNVLLVASDDSTERRLLKLIENSIQDFEFYVTTLEQLLDPENMHKPIWKDDTFDDQAEDEEVELRRL